MIPFKSIQHFFLFEKRPKNKLNGKITSHPFACVAIGFDPSEPKLPFRVAASFCHPKDNMARRIGAVKAKGLLHSTSESHTRWISPVDKNLKTILWNLGFGEGLAARFKSTTNKIEWTRAQKAFKNVLTDIQGKRINEPLKAAKA
jgi:hypothetical protein